VSETVELSLGIPAAPGI